MAEWQDIITAPEGVEIMTKIDGGNGERNVQSLVKRTRIPGETRPMFWYPDGSMYVYYEPTHWQVLFKAIEAVLCDDKSKLGRHAATEWADFVSGEIPAVPMFKRRAGLAALVGAY